MTTSPTLPRFIQQQLPYAIRHATAAGFRVAYLDEGRGTPVVMFHGNPAWSFLWRKVIRCMEARSSDVRLVAPDLVGFGLSDKPSEPSAHQLAMHLEVMTAFVVALGLEQPVLVGQDWGGPIAAGVGMQLEQRGRRVGGFVFANTAVIEPKRPFRSKAFHRFSHVPFASDLAFRGLLFPVPVLRTVQGDRASIGLRETAAYAWPFLRMRDRAGPLGLARMVPDSEMHPSTALLDEIGAFICSSTAPTALVWGTRDPILGRALDRHKRALPRASVRVSDAGHFLQEEVPELVADAIAEVVAARMNRVKTDPQA